MSVLQIVRNSFGQRLTFSVVDSDGAGVHLTGYTPYFKMWPEGSPDKVLVNVTCTIDVPDTSCHYDVLTGIFTVSGKFKGVLNWVAVGSDIRCIPFDVEILEAP